MNNKIITKSMKILAGLMVCSSIATPVLGSAATLRWGTHESHYTVGKWYGPGDIRWREDRESWDYFGEWTLDGQVVWCVEPSIVTTDGSDYDSDGDDAIRNGARIRTLFDETDDRGAEFFKLTAYMTWLAYKATDQQIDLIIAYAKENNPDVSRKFENEIRYVRSLNRDQKWTAMQLMVWYTISYVLTKNHRTDSYLKSVLDRYDSYPEIDSAYQAYAAVGRKLFKDGVLSYRGGFALHSSGDQQRLYSGGGDFDLRLRPKEPKPAPKVEEYDLKVYKEFSAISGNLSKRATFNPDGIEVGVYSDANATQYVGKLRINSNGESNTLKVKKGTYYGFELDQNGNPIKTLASDVRASAGASKGYVSGKDKATGNPYVTWNVDGRLNNKVYNATFVNTPEVVNFTFNKEIADQNIKPLEGLDNQYSREGAVYTLYEDEGATRPVTRNGQPITATIGKNGSAQFNDLYRGVYYVKETSVPTVTKNGRKFKRFDLDRTVYKVDLTTVKDNQISTSDVTVSPTKEYTKNNAFASNETLAPKAGSLTIKKKDAESNSNVAQGQATLANAEFKVEFYDAFSLGTQFPVKKWEAVYKTNDKGEIDVRNRQQMVSSTNADAMNKLFTAYERSKEWGAYDYRVTEVKAPNGYKLDSKSQDFVVKPKGNSDFVSEWSYDDASFLNKDLELYLVKTQRSSGDWLTSEQAKKVVIKDATFELTNKTTGQKFVATTNAEGKLHFDGVIAGEYTLKETGAKKYKTNGQIINLTVSQKDGTTKLTASSKSTPTEDNGAFNVTETADKNIMVEFENTAIDAKGKLIKTNEKGARLEGAKFKLTHFNEDGLKQIDEKVISTDAKGELNFEKLVIGHWYTLEEVEAPSGYKLPAERTVLRFRAEAMPAKDSYAISYWISTLDKTNENNTAAKASTIKKISREGVTQDGIKFDADEAKGTMAIEFDFVNNTWKKLPATGSSVGSIIVVSALVVIVGSTVLYIKKREA